MNNITFTKCYPNAVAFSPKFSTSTCKDEFGDDAIPSKTFNNDPCKNGEQQIGCIVKQNTTITITSAPLQPEIIKQL